MLLVLLLTCSSISPILGLAEQGCSSPWNPYTDSRDESACVRVLSDQLEHVDADAACMRAGNGNLPVFLDTADLLHFVSYARQFLPQKFFIAYQKVKLVPGADDNEIGIPGSGPVLPDTDIFCYLPTMPNRHGKTNHVIYDPSDSLAGEWCEKFEKEKLKTQVVSNCAIIEILDGHDPPFVLVEDCSVQIHTICLKWMEEFQCDLGNGEKTWNGTTTLLYRDESCGQYYCRIDELTLQYKMNCPSSPPSPLGTCKSSRCCKDENARFCTKREEAMDDSHADSVLFPGDGDDEQAAEDQFVSFSKMSFWGFLIVVVVVLIALVLILLFFLNNNDKPVPAFHNVMEFWSNNRRRNNERAECEAIEPACSAVECSFANYEENMGSRTSSEYYIMGEPPPIYNDVCPSGVPSGFHSAARRMDSIHSVNSAGEAPPPYASNPASAMSSAWSLPHVRGANHYRSIQDIDNSYADNVPLDPQRTRNASGKGVHFSDQVGTRPRVRHASAEPQNMRPRQMRDRHKSEEQSHNNRPAFIDLHPPPPGEPINSDPAPTDLSSSQPTSALKSIMAPAQRSRTRRGPNVQPIIPDTSTESTRMRHASADHAMRPRSILSNARQLNDDQSAALRSQYARSRGTTLENPAIGNTSSDPPNGEHRPRSSSLSGQIRRAASGISVSAMNMLNSGRDDSAALLSGEVNASYEDETIC